MNEQTRNFQQRCILSLIQLTDDWQDWANRYARTESQKNLHLWMIRFAKGAIKSWRLYLIEAVGQDIPGVKRLEQNTVPKCNQ